MEVEPQIEIYDQCIQESSNNQLIIDYREREVLEKVFYFTSEVIKQFSNNKSPGNSGRTFGETWPLRIEIKI